MKRAAIIVAGGSGKRMGTALPKQFLPLDGVPILIRTIQKFLPKEGGLPLVLVLPETHWEIYEKISLTFFTRQQRESITLSPGGATRTLSVYSGLQTLQESVNEPADYLVAIQDAVRPFITTAIIDHAYQLAELHGASVVCVPVKSSLRQKTETGSKAIDRSAFYHVQTPQTFQFKEILEAYQHRAHDTFTDDASLFEAAGKEVFICEGSYENIKITTPEDMIIAEEILKKG